MRTDQPKTPVGHRTELGLELEKNARDTLAHVKGEKQFSTRRIVLPDEASLKQICGETEMSPAEFARAFCAQSRTPHE